MSGKIDQVTLVANAFLEVMAEVTIAHLLLERRDRRRREARERRGRAEPARDRLLQRQGDGGEALRELRAAGVHAKVGGSSRGDRSALDMPDRGFSTVV